jgi:hypothetical protein
MNAHCARVFVCVCACVRACVCLCVGVGVCVLHAHKGHIYTMGCGVLAQAVSRTTISHNDINHFSYTGVSLGWTWNYIDTSNRDNEVGRTFRARWRLMLVFQHCRVAWVGASVQARVACSNMRVGNAACLGH